MFSKITDWEIILQKTICVLHLKFGKWFPVWPRQVVDRPQERLPRWADAPPERAVTAFERQFLTRLRSRGWTCLALTLSACVVIWVDCCEPRLVELFGKMLGTLQRGAIGLHTRGMGKLVREATNWRQVGQLLGSLLLRNGHQRGFATDGIQQRFG